MRLGMDEGILRGIAGVFARQPAISEARIYGSRARGDFKDVSDIDIALFAPDLTFRDFLLLRSDLDDLPCLYKLDTTHFDTLENEGLKETILREGVPFYRRDRNLAAGAAYPEPESEPMFVREDFGG
jgi:predicted nucleotidyltransferase